MTRFFILASALFILTGCFRPMYAQQNSELKDGMSIQNAEVELVVQGKGEPAIMMRQELSRYISTSRYRTNEPLKLIIRISSKNISYYQDVERDAPSFGAKEINAIYELKNSETNKIILKDSERITASYRPRYNLENKEASARDAELRAIKTLAERIDQNIVIALR